MPRSISSVPKPRLDRFSIFGPPSSAQISSGIAALEGPREPARRMVAAFAERREMIVRALNGLPGFRCARPGGAFYTFPNVTGTGLDARALQARLLEEAGIATIAGTSFGAFGEGYLRFSYANSREAIAEAVERIRRLLENLPAPKPAVAASSS